MNGVELIASWLTPTVLFCVLNLMIGTIYITSSSNLKPHRKSSSQNVAGDKDEIDPPPAPKLSRVPSIFERVTSFNFSRYQHDPSHYAVVPPPPQLERSAGHNHHKQQDLDHETEIAHHHVTRSKSQPSETATPAVRKVLKKSASEKVAKMEEEVVDRRWPATVREKKTVEDPAVDDKADDFINKFRQQLKLQRLDSILRYKEMMKRGT